MGNGGLRKQRVGIHHGQAKVFAGLIAELSNSLDVRNPVSIAHVLALYPITLPPGQRKLRKFKLSVQIAVCSWRSHRCLMLNGAHQLSLSFSLSDQLLLLGLQSQSVAHPHPSLTAVLGSWEPPLPAASISRLCYLVQDYPQCYP